MTCTVGQQGGWDRGTNAKILEMDEWVDGWMDG